MSHPASKVTRVTLDADRQILSGGTISTYAIYFANNTGGAQQVDLKDNDGTIRMSFVVPQNDTFSFETKMVWDKGLTIASIGDVNFIVDVLHDSVGA